MALVIDRLRTVECEFWADAFCRLAPVHAERAAKAEAAGDSATARKEYVIAYGCYHVARYPAPNSPAKMAAYWKSQEYFYKAARYFDPPVERVEMPFHGRAGEGSVSIGLLRKPRESLN
ncbi:MAG TPA: alpha/beta hydrolase, partial [Candidatus Binatia bacterium]|nr:alpha/beta hydrolase [Candidatus Binatia bacterium]